MRNPRRRLSGKTSLALLALAGLLSAELVFVLMALSSAEARIPIGDPIVDQYENLLVNGNFQSKDGRYHPLRWKLVSPRTMPGTNAASTLDAVVTREKKMESEDSSSDDPVGASLKVMANGAGEMHVRSERRLAIPGMVYSATARVYQVSGTPGELKLEFWDATNGFSGTASSVLAPAPDARTDWKQITVSGTAPANALHVTVSIFSSTSAVGVNYWDNVTLNLQSGYVEEVAAGVHELFVDDYRLESSFDVERVVQAPKKSGTLVVKDKSWESDSVMMSGTVLKMPGTNLYKMWYYSNGRTLYATSTNGTNWVKPVLNSYTYGSNKSNNIAFPPGLGRLTVVYDENDTNATRRYKALVHSGTAPGYFYYYSPTGTNGWVAGNGGAAVLPYGSLGNLAYNSETGKFIATTRQQTVSAGTGATFTDDRMAFVSTSTNMINWTSPGYSAAQYSPAVEGDQADDLAAQSRRHIESQVYSMPVYPYESVYIGFPNMLQVENFSGTTAGVQEGAIYPQIASSRDLRVWNRPNRSPIIPLSRKGGWDAGGIHTASSMVHDVANGKLYVYYSGSNLEQGTAAPNGKTLKSSIARAEWDSDRLVSIHNAAVPSYLAYEGFVKTKKIRFASANTLRINAKVNTGGQIKVAILDASDVPIDDFALSSAVSEGDYTDKIISWSGNTYVTPLINTSIKLKFFVRNADLYSFWFE